MKKIRLDELMAGRELATDAKEASALVMAGLVFSGESRLEKPGQLVPLDLPVSVRGKGHPYVSRGGLKLKGAFDHWKLDVRGLRCLDLGASTGGFTDCLLQQGASTVVAVDSGNNQLDWKLRSDARVLCLERTDARTLKAEAIGGEVDFACLDLSFIGLEQVFPALQGLLKPGASWVALVKPQFELARHEVPEGGVVMDALARASVLEAVRASAEKQGLGPGEAIESPIHGRDGNVEFLLLGRSQKVVHN